MCRPISERAVSEGNVVRLQTERQRSSAKIQESLEKGIRKGRKEGIQQTARQLLKDGAAIEKLVKWTGLSEEQLKQLTP